MTDYTISYRDITGGNVTGVNADIVSNGVIDLSMFNTWSSSINDAIDFFDAVDSFTYLRGRLVLNFTDHVSETESVEHSLTITDFSTRASANYRIKLDSGDVAARFLVSQLAISLTAQSLSATEFTAGAVIDGGSGVDTILGSSGADTIDGHAGIDTINYGSASGGITYDGTAAADEDGFRAVTVDGSDGDDKVKNIEGFLGTGYADAIKVNALGAATRFLAGDDDDTVTLSYANAGKAQAHYFDGGGGVDSLLLQGANNYGDLIVDLDRGSRLTITIDGDSTVSSLKGFENVDLSDATNAYSSDKDFTFIGNRGSNEFKFGSGAMAKVALDGGAGIDTLDFSARTTGVYINQNRVAVDDSFAGNFAGNLAGYELAGGGFGAGSSVRNFEKFIGTSQIDVLFTGAGNDEIQGGAGSDSIYAGSGNNIVDAGSGYDRIAVSKGNDIIDGGADVDIIDYSGDIGARDGVEITLNDGVDVAADFRRIANRRENDIITNIENIVGTGGNDILIGNNADNILLGDAGNDILDGGAGGDTLYGGAGDDILDGGAGSDTLHGGAGDDTFKFNEIIRFTHPVAGDSFVTTRFNGDEGKDTVDFSASFYTTTDNDGNEITYGINVDLAQGRARINAPGDENAQIGFLEGVENIYGTDYDESITGNSMDNILKGNGGVDRIDGAAGDDEIDGGAGDDDLRGRSGNDKIDGGAGIDVLYGEDGDDIIDGGAGNDTLHGGAGANELSGGTGEDIYYVTKGSTDTIFDSDAASTKTEIDLTDLGIFDFLHGASSGEKLLFLLDQGFSFRRIGNHLELNFIDPSDGVETKTTVRDFYRRGGRPENYEFIVQTDLDRTAAPDAANQVISGDGFVQSIGRVTGADGTIASTATGTQYLGGSNYNARGRVGDELTGRDDGSSATSIDHIYGFAGNDIIDGRAGVDLIYGGDGDDTLTGGAGSDIIDGGDGRDTASYATSTGGVTYDFTAANTDYVGVGGDAVGDKLISIEGVIGSATGDTFSVSASGAVHAVTSVAAGEGDDKVVLDLANIGSAGVISGISLDGGAGSDTLVVQGIDSGSIKSLTINLGRSTLSLITSDDARYSIRISNFEDLELTGFASIDEWLVLGNGAANKVTFTDKPTMVGTSGSISLANGDDRIVFRASDTFDGFNLRIDGGRDSDTIDFSSLEHLLNLDLAKTNEQAINANGASLQIRNLENVIVPGNVAAATTGNNVVHGNGAANIITGARAEFHGAGGSDVFRTSGDGNTLYADPLDAFVVSTGSTLANSDTLSYDEYGPTRGNVGVSIDLSPFATYGSISDLVEYSSGEFYFEDDAAGFAGVVGSSGNDDISIGSRARLLSGGAGDDRLVSGSRAIQVLGEAGDDTLVLGRTNTGIEISLEGGVGDDTFVDIGDTVANRVSLAGGSGVDTVDYSSGVTLRGADGSATAANPAAGYGISLTINGVARAIDGGVAVTGNAGVVTKAMTGIENAIGTDSADSITGDGGANKIDGGAGADTLSGGAGDDTLDGGEGNDVLLVGGTGDDIIYGGRTYVVTEIVDGRRVRRTIESGDDTLDGGDGADELYGGDGVDTLKGGSSRASGETIGGKDDFLTTDRRGNLIIDSNALRDAPKNILEGGSGGDTYIIGANSVNEIRDADANTVIDFTGVGPVNFGGNGDNGYLLTRFLHFATSDTSFASKRVGNDLVIIITSVEEKMENNVLASYSYSSLTSSSVDYQTVTNIKGFYSRGMADRITFKFKGSDDGALTLVDKEIAGTDFLAANRVGGTVDFSDTATTSSKSIVGTNSAETIRGNDEGHEIYGLDGNDRLYGNGGDDTIYGGDGNDIVEGGAGDDEIEGGDGNDVIRGEDGSDSISGNAGNDEIYGGAVSNAIGAEDQYLDGGAGEDRIYGGGDTDIITGGTGDDRLYGGAGGDEISGEDDDDYIEGGAGGDTIYGGEGADEIYGGVGDDDIEGGTGDDTIFGGDDNDRKLDGGAGNDIIDGGAGDDTMQGGGENDLFVNLGLHSRGVFTSGIDTIDGDAGTDTADFSSGGLSVSRTENYGISVTLSGDTEASVTLTGDVAENNYKLAGLKNVENVYGTNYGDVLTGDGEDNLLRGNGGDDTLTSGAGTNRLEGGGGVDAYVITAGSDNVISDTDRGTRVGSRSVIDFTTLEAVELGSVGISDFERFVQTDTVSVSRDDNDLVLRIVTGTGNDAVTTNVRVENFYRVAGAYEFGFNVKTSATAEAATLEVVGSEFIFGTARATLTGVSHTLDGVGLRDDSLIGRDSDGLEDTLNGGFGNDRLDGRKGVDKLNGGDGGDTLIGGLGADVLDGGTGFDTADYSASNEGVVMTLATTAGGGFADISGGHATGDTIINVERVVGSRLADTITASTATAGTIEYEVVGGGGNDRLVVDFGADSVTTADVVTLSLDFDGGSDRGTVDTLALTGRYQLSDAATGISLELADSGEVSISGLANVELKGIENIDLSGFSSNADVVTVMGNRLVNTITLGAATVSLDAQDGSDTVKIGDGVGSITSLVGGEGRSVDVLDFSGRSKGINLDLTDGTLSGRDGDTTLSAGAGAISGFERVIGTIANDQIRGREGINDNIDGGDGIDTISYAGDSAGVSITLRDDSRGRDVAAAFSRVGSRERDTLINFENIIGTVKDDTLGGDSAANKLEGGSGNDIIDGGAGADTLMGDAGDDTFINLALHSRGVFTSGVDMIDGGADSDTADFSRGGSSVSRTVNYGVEVTLSGASEVSATLNDGGTTKLVGLKNVENVYGTNYGDNIVGDGNDNLLRGNGGDDKLKGEGGDDTIEGGDGNDNLAGGTGTNRLEGGRGNDIYSIAQGATDTIVDGAGTTIDLTKLGTFSGVKAAPAGARVAEINAVGLQSLIALLKNNNFDSDRPDGSNDLVLTITGTESGTAFTSTVTLTNFYRATGNYKFVFKTGGTTAETLTTAEVSGIAFSNILRPQTLSIDAAATGEQTLDGGLGNDRLTGRDIEEAALIDNINGGGGNDIINGGAGVDIIDGGAGEDTLDYRGSDAGVTMTLPKSDKSYFEDVSGGDAEGDTIRDFEIIFGSDARPSADLPSGGGDSFTLAVQASVAYKIYGHNGDDRFTVDFAANNREFFSNTLDGGAGVDTLALINGNIAGALAIDFARRSMTLTRAGEDDVSNTISGFENLDLSGYTSSLALRFVGTAGTNLVKMGSFATTSALYLDGGRGVDTLDFTGRTGAITLNLGDESSYGAGKTIKGFEHVVGGDGADVLTGSGAGNRLEGGDGDDTLAGGGGNDIIDGGAGIDTVSYAGEGGGVIIALQDGDEAASFRRGRERDTITNVENIIGSDGADTLSGNSAANRLAGGAGADTFKFGEFVKPSGGSVDADTIDGGADTDTLDLSESSLKVGEVSYGFDVALEATTDNLKGYDKTGSSNNAVNSEVLANIQNVENVVGTQYADFFRGNNDANELRGGDGVDKIWGRAGNDIIYGGAGNDGQLAGDAGDDIIYGEAGNDRAIEGGGGNDRLYGGVGNDVLSGESGRDSLYGGAGIDTLVSGIGVNRLEGGADYDTYRITPGIINGRSVNTIYDNGGVVDLTLLANVFSGATNALALADANGFEVTTGRSDWTFSFTDGGKVTEVTIVNFARNHAGYTFKFKNGIEFASSDLRNFYIPRTQTYREAIGTDAAPVLGSSGNDRLTGQAGSQVFDGLAGNDILVGGADADTLRGGAGDDTLIGGTEGDTLTGGTGDDTLDGGAGDDILQGGDGDDRFLNLGEQFSGRDTIDGGDGRDFADFSGAGTTIARVGHGVTINLNDGTATGGRAGANRGDAPQADADYGTLANVEDITASRYADEITLALSDASINDIKLGDGDDTLKLTSSSKIDGTDQKDIYDGGRGADTLDLSGVADRAGDVTYIYLTNNDPLPAVIAPLPHELVDEEEEEVPTPDPTITGNDGDNTINIPAGAGHVVAGGAGADTYSFANSITEVRILDDGGELDFAKWIQFQIFIGDGPVRLLNTRQGFGDGQKVVDMSIDDGDLTFNIRYSNVTGKQDEIVTIVIDDFVTNAAGFSFTFKDGGPALAYDTTGDALLAAWRAAGGVDSVQARNIDRPSDAHAVADADDGYITRVTQGASFDGTTISNYDQVALARNFEHVIGTEGDDRIVGTNAANRLEGGAGNDHIVGDLLTAGRANGNTAGGSDEIHGGDGADTIFGMAGDDIIYGGAGNDKIYGGRGNDLIVGGANTAREILDGGAGVDTISYRDSTVGVRIDLSATESFGGSVSNARSDASFDIITSVENIIGSAVNDIITGSDARSFREDQEPDIEHLAAYPADADPATAGFQFDSRDGFRADESVFNGANKLEGLAGNDVLQGKGGNDIIDGGEGVDTVSYAGETVGVTVTLRDDSRGRDVAAAFTRHDRSRERDTITNVENIRGSDADDILTGDSGANKLEGNRGDDTIDGGVGADNLQGGTGSDTFRNLGLHSRGVFTSGIDTIDGGADTDIADFSRGGSSVSRTENYGIKVDLNGITSADVTLNGDAPNNYKLAGLKNVENVYGTNYGDNIVGDASANLLKGNSGDDTLKGEDGDDVIEGGVGDDTIYGGTGEDSIEGGAGIDTIYGGDDIDNIRGGDGNDIITGGTGNDIIYGDRNDDTINGGDGDDEIYGGRDHDTIYGGAGVDTIEGGDGNDIIRGGGDGDIIDGGAGNDEIDGGAGSNTLIGGAGSDTYIITQGSTDTIRDTGGVIDLTGVTITGADGNIIDLRTGGELSKAILQEYLEALRAQTIGDGGTAIDLDASGLTLNVATVVEDSSTSPATTTTTITSIRIEGFSTRSARDFRFILKGNDGTDFEVKGTDITGVVTSPEVTIARGETELSGGIFSDSLKGSNNGETLSGGDSSDNLLGLGGDDILQGGTGNDVLDGGTGEDTLYGEDGDDTLIGGIGDDTLLSGGDGDDTLNGGAGSDTIDGGDGIDTVSYDAPRLRSGIALVLNALNTAEATFTGAGGDAEGDKVKNVENFIGTSRDDFFTLTAGNVVSAYSIDGNGGRDTFALTGSSTTGLTIDLAAATVAIGGSETKLSNIELVDISGLTTTGAKAVLTGSAEADLVTIGDEAGGYTNANGIGGDLGAGDDILYVGGYAYDDAATAFSILGGDGYDTIDFSDKASGGVTFGFSNRGFERAIGTDHEDRFISDDLANKAEGGDGVDTIDYSGASSAVAVNLALGGRAQFGSVASQGDILTSIENIIGSAFSDNLRGSSVNNVITGGAGADIINGDRGIDTVRYASSSEGVTVDLNGVFQVGRTSYGYGSGGDAEGDRLLGIENIIGSGAADVLIGNGVANTLEGRAGTDTLDGGDGDDRLVGGADADTYNIIGGRGNGGRDTIVDDGGAVNFHSYNDEVDQSRDGDDLIISSGTRRDIDSFTIEDYFVAGRAAAYTIQQSTDDGASFTTFVVDTSLSTST